MSSLLARKHDWHLSSLIFGNGHIWSHIWNILGTFTGTISFYWLILQGISKRSFKNVNGNISSFSLHFTFNSYTAQFCIPAKMIYMLSELVVLHKMHCTVAVTVDPCCNTPRCNGIPAIYVRFYWFCGKSRRDSVLDCCLLRSCNLVFLYITLCWVWHGHSGKEWRSEPPGRRREIAAVVATLPQWEDNWAVLWQWSFRAPVRSFDRSSSAIASTSTCVLKVATTRCHMRMLALSNDPEAWLIELCRQHNPLMKHD